MAYTILFTGSTLPFEAKQRLERLGYKVIVERPDLKEEELIARLEGVSAYILGGSEKASQRVIEQAKDLRVIAFFGVGYESFVDVATATRCGVAVTNTPYANARSVAEFTMTLMLGAVKRLVYLVGCTKKGIWQEYSTWNLQNRTLGIVGLGTIGSQVASMAYHGFGMHILYTGRTAKPVLDEQLQARFVSLDELLRMSDIVSLHASFNPQTQNMLGAAQFSLMKPNSVLINAARAELVDPWALQAAIQERRVAVAAFDGYYQEPVPPPEKDQYGLVGLSNEHMIISPHTAYLTDDAVQAMTDMSIESVLAILQGHEASRIVNPEYMYHVKNGV